MRKVREGKSPFGTTRHNRFFLGLSVAFVLAFGFSAAAQNPEITVRFANPVFDCDTGIFCVDVEFQGDPKDTEERELFGMNVRFFYDSEVLNFLAFGGFEGGYGQLGTPAVNTGGSTSGDLWGFDNPATFVNGAVQLLDLGPAPVLISNTGWTKLFNICFEVLDPDPAVLGMGAFCPSLVWDLEEDPANGGFLQGSNGVVMTLVNVRGVTTLPVDERVLQYNWAYSGPGTPPWGTPDPTVCINTYCPEVQIEKVAALLNGTMPPPFEYAQVGDEMSYEITLINTGNVGLENVEVIDPQATTGPVYVGGDLNEDGILDTTEIWVYTATYEITQADLDNGSFTNIATVTAMDPDGGETSDMDEETVDADQVPSIALAKTLDPVGQTYDAVGDVITYQITLTNDGNVTVYAPSVSDPQATTGPTYVSGDANDNGILDVGETWVYTAAYEITQADLDAGSFTNTATGSGSADTTGDGEGDTPVSDENDETVHADQNPALTVSKALTDAPDPIVVGSTVTYTLTATNTGNVTLNNVTVSDSLITPSFTSCASVAPGDTCVLVGTYVVTQADMDTGEIVNTGAADSDETDPEEDTETTLLNQIPSIALAKTLDPAGPTYDAVGDVITYRITLTNDGNVTVYDPSVSDPQATTGPTYVSGDANANGILDVGETWVYEASYTITQVDLDAGSFTNVATGSGSADTTGDGEGDTPVSDENDETVDADQNPALTVSKALTDAPDPIVVGSTVTYTLTATNTGNVTLNNVTVSDSLITPSFTSCASVAPGDTCVLVGTYVVTQADMDSGEIVNTGAADSDETDPEEDTETTLLNQVPSIALAKTLDPAGQTYDAVGDVITYQITLTNDGNVTVYAPSVSDPQATTGPAYVSGDANDNGILDVGETWVYEASYTITQVDLDAGSFTNVATASGSADTTGDGEGDTPVSDTDDETVDAAPNAINAVDDDYSAVPVNGYDGNPNVGDVLDNDTLNGDPTDLTEVTLTVVTPATPVNPGDPVPTVDPVTGVVSVPPGTPANTYTIIYEICEILNTSNCDTATITVAVDAPDIEAVDDDYSATPVVAFDGESNVGNVLDNDTLNGDPTDLTEVNLTVVTPASDPGVNLDEATGIVSVAAGTPAGTYTIVYEICEILNPTNCDTATITVLVVCVEINAAVFLEGALIDVNNPSVYSTVMRTDLNDLRVLPGQTYEDVFFGVVYTEPGQPYNVAPWFYNGTEGQWYDSLGDSANGDAGYPDTVVDWVLVSLRDTPEGTGGPVCQAAALLHEDGSIEFVGNGLGCCDISGDAAYYVVVEHRNHLIVMSHESMPVGPDGVIDYDFRIQNSYVFDPLGFGFARQKEVLPGTFAMLGGNGEQAEEAHDDTDITFADRTFWENENGEFGAYLFGDYNLDGDAEFNDRMLWELNNGEFTSVPRD